MSSPYFSTSEAALLPSPAGVSPPRSKSASPMPPESAAMTAGLETPIQATARDSAATFPLSVHDGASEGMNRGYSENNIATPPASPAREVLPPTVSMHLQMANSIVNKTKISQRKVSVPKQVSPVKSNKSSPTTAETPPTILEVIESRSKRATKPKRKRSHEQFAERENTATGVEAIAAAEPKKQKTSDYVPIEGSRYDEPELVYATFKPIATGPKKAQPKKESLAELIDKWEKEPQPNRGLWTQLHPPDKTPSVRTGPVNIKGGEKDLGAPMANPGLPRHLRHEIIPEKENTSKGRSWEQDPNDSTLFRKRHPKKGPRIIVPTGWITLADLENDMDEHIMYPQYFLEDLDDDWYVVGMRQGMTEDEIAELRKANKEQTKLRKKAETKRKRNGGGARPTRRRSSITTSDS